MKFFENTINIFDVLESKILLTLYTLFYGRIINIIMFQVLFWYISLMN